MRANPCQNTPCQKHLISTSPLYNTLILKTILRVAILSPLIPKELGGSFFMLLPAASIGIFFVGKSGFFNWKIKSHHMVVFLFVHSFIIVFKFIQGFPGFDISQKKSCPLIV